MSIKKLKNSLLTETDLEEIYFTNASVIRGKILKCTLRTNRKMQRQKSEFKIPNLRWGSFDLI